MKKLVIGILAHVDAGKTTLAESLLYLTGSIRKFGRVDHKNAFLDNYDLERSRGITIFSKQAVISYKNLEITLLDTPGHVDFSAEMERTLQVLDYAILVISGSDGIQGHTETLWKLLCQYKIPTFLFINKMDLKVRDNQSLMDEFKEKLDEGCVDFSKGQDINILMENLALCHENLLNQYIEIGNINRNSIVEAIFERKVFPCYFGSALKIDGVEELLDGLNQYTKSNKYPTDFAAKVYKISRDEQGNRLTHMKITGGLLKVKMELTNKKESRIVSDLDHKKTWEEKVDQIRIYSGSKYYTVDQLEAGTVCAVTGLSNTFPGEGLGMEEDLNIPILKPVLTYQLILPPECNAFSVLSQLRQLEEEDPMLHIVWHEKLQEIHIQLMGEVQTEILKTLIKERFNLDVEFGPGNILYKETIEEAVVGVGHFEPLRHYAEVHLLLEPGEPGSGLIFDSKCSEDDLEGSWQRLILTHLKEKEHLGILTGSPITDIKITLIAGRAHLKHTEGGDFRQATYRAIRQGLKKAKSILLEPYYSFKLELPTENVGRAMTDIQRMKGSFDPPQINGDMALLIGNAPVATMSGYQVEVNAYTRGRGNLFCTPAGYQPCHNFEEVISKIDYDSEQDFDNPTGSVFCSHGESFLVKWDQVEEYMHIESAIWNQYLKDKAEDKAAEEDKNTEPIKNKSLSKNKDFWQEDKELEEIFTRTYGPIKQSPVYTQSRLGYENKKAQTKKAYIKTEANKKLKEYLLVDGYNIIFSWDELKELATENMDAARYRLMDILCNYQGFNKCTVILVFDAYKVKGGLGEVQKYKNINVVYTKEAETADQYIEKVTYEIAKDNHVVVATSDALEQLIILGMGSVRLSANDLKEEIIRVNTIIRQDYMDKPSNNKAYMGELLSEEWYKGSNIMKEDI
ncbi:translation factor GTPase family protein [Herbinix luporum]|uniref:translation factor GTPase family protein n=1 Tax=Herbinix luporum TaxID=1679721 RepID=UPI0023F3ACC5|nr:TetM/TetW/TetO/TetS family tetracycline resistance ribosomal protection protein [Herbinix luporum]